MDGSKLSTTYSIVAADAEEVGVAVQTHQMCVGSRVPWILPGVGAVATQSLMHDTLGPMGLRLLELGVNPARAVEALCVSDPDIRRRQIGLVNAAGVAAAFTGEDCIREAGHRVGRGYSVQASMMMRDDVIDAMAIAFESTTDGLAERMLAALSAAEEHDGDIRGMQSAALLTAPAGPDVRPWKRIFDLRVDESETPLSDLERLVRLRRAQLIDESGHRLLDAGHIEAAMERFANARRLAPELEELAFWQAVSVMEREPGYRDWAVKLLQNTLEFEAHPHRWYELIERLEQAGFLTTDGMRQDLDSV